MSEIAQGTIFESGKRIRRSSFSTISGGMEPNEPLIVVEESDGIAEEEEEEEEEEQKPSPPESMSINQYLLSPWRDTRKRSLPTPACTSGITASQVRRLSERGGEGSGPTPMEQAFLATLSQAPAPTPGARRHSVVTISKAPPLPPLFGRNRRESIAAFAAGLPGLPLRRESVTSQPRGSLSGVSNSGSSFNLHLDIMDDIMEAKARAKEKRKLSRAKSKDRMDESEFSDANKPSTSDKCSPQGKKPDSELPLQGGKKNTGPGIVCSNTDLISILSPLTSSAQEICNAAEKESLSAMKNPNTGSPTQQKSVLDKKRRQFKDRSNSFDVGSLPGTSSGPASWFVKRHQPIAKKEDPTNQKSNIMVTFMDEKQKTQTSLVNKPERSKSFKGTTDSSKTTSPTRDRNNQVVWDNRSGSLVDPHLLGSAIEVFLNQKTSQEPTSPVTKSPTQTKDSPTKTPAGVSKSWFGSNNQEAVSESSSDTCETSICSTLKDLFVK